MKMSILGRILLLIATLLAAYQVAVGTDGLSTVPTLAYSIAFGVILVAGLLLIILGFEVLDLPIVVIVSTIIPLSLATGLVWQHFTSYKTLYLVFAFLGLLAVVITRILPLPKKLTLFVIVVVHGVAGLTIFLLPIILVSTGRSSPGYTFVSVGGALIGLGGALLALLKAGKPLLSREAILKVLPGLLLLMSAAFVAGFTLTR